MTVSDRKSQCAAQNLENTKPERQVTLLSRTEDVKVEINDSEIVSRLQLTCNRIEFWSSVSRARNDAKELRERNSEVEELRDEKQEEGLAEMAKDASHPKGHAGKVCETVANKYLGRIPVVVDQGKRACKKRQREKHGQLVLSSKGSTKLKVVMNQNRAGNNARLGGLQTIDTGIDVDRIGAKHCN